MKSQHISFCARRLMAIVAMSFAFLTLNGCGGEEDHSADTHEAGEHDEAESQAPRDDHADDDRAEAGHDEAEEGAAEHHGEEAEFAEPHNYAEAIHVIHEQLEKIEALIGSQKLDQVHTEAAVIRDVANTLAKFALFKDSGIPQGEIRGINIAARELASRFEAIDEAGDSGDLAGTQKVYDEMVKLFENLEQYVTVAYACPMNCEADKAYTMAGNCTVCGMTRKPIIEDEQDDHG